MDSDEEIMYDDYDSGNESSGDEDVEFAMVEEPNNPKDRQELDDYPYEVLTTEQILQHMNECMKEVNIVVEVMRVGFNDDDNKQTKCSLHIRCPLLWFECC